MAEFIKDLGPIEYGTQGRKKTKYRVRCTQCTKTEYDITKEDFLKYPNSVCEECQIKNRAKTRIQNHKNSFIKKANKIHNNRYDYTLTDYTGVFEKIVIKCPLHNKFTIRPNSHLNGQGCPKCGNNAKGKSRNKKAKEKFKIVAAKLHNNKYDYEKVDYINTWTKVTITCPIHGNFNQTPNNHLHGRGCPKCHSPSDFDVLYIWKVANTNFYKIGVTSERLDHQRITIASQSLSKALSYKVEPIIIFTLNTKNALDIEKILLSTFTKMTPYREMEIDGKTEYREMSEEDIDKAIEITKKYRIMD